MTERELQDLFREMRDESVPADSLARVRMGVDQRLRKRGWWKLAVPLIAAGWIVAGFFLLRPVSTPAPPQQPSAPEIARVITQPDVPVQPVASSKHIRRPRQVQAVPVMIRIETPDPDVVILLVN
jgi:hypothetical protein